MELPGYIPNSLEQEATSKKVLTPQLNFTVPNHGNASTFFNKYNSVHTIILDGDYDAVKRKLNSGTDVDAREDATGKTPLMIASRAGNIDIVNLLLERGADVNAKDKGNVTALHLASHGGNTEIVKILCDKNAEVDAATSKDGVTPLLFAIDRKHVDIVAILLKYGANKTKPDNKGRTPLAISIMKKTTSKRKHIEKLEKIEKLLSDPQQGGRRKRRKTGRGTRRTTRRTKRNIKHRRQY